MDDSIVSAKVAAFAGAAPRQRPILRSRGETAPAPPKVLLVSSLFKLPYRVLRCAARAGAQIRVLGGRQSKGLRHSRYCEGFTASSRAIDGRFDAALAAEINELVRRHSIDLVIAADAPSTRSLICVEALVDAACFPMPSLAQFDLLNDKWRFTELCNETGILCPDTWLFQTPGEIEQAFAQGRLGGALIAKPLSMDSGIGCVRIGASAPGVLARKLLYRPILVQRYIEGGDIAANLFCSSGRIEAFSVHHYRRGVFTTYFDRGVYRELDKLVRRLGLSGVYNFDMRTDASGRVFYLECNPRVSYKMDMSMLAGINFLALGLGGPRQAPPAILSKSVSLRWPKGMLAALPTPWKLRGATWEALKFVLEDPAPFVREKAGLERERRTLASADDGAESSAGPVA